ncbi:hypothetical protein HPB47_011074 [Ixodes persulcatus]|uniref:Uncharacterized protein n=1 Tax=Ixodes persulcatus TaxID=34615 RepID=A0AC60NXA7_IXOPE|nr:hypothetical protein HPB47_011074 [Ixodes persulcatus]
MEALAQTEDRAMPKCHDGSSAETMGPLSVGTATADGLAPEPDRKYETNCVRSSATAAGRTWHPEQLTGRHKKTRIEGHA